MRSEFAPKPYFIRKVDFVFSFLTIRERRLVCFARTNFSPVACKSGESITDICFSYIGRITQLETNKV